MKHLSNLPTSTILDWWAQAESGDEYTFVVRQAYALGYRLTKDQARREIHERLLDASLLPVGRPPTPADYNRIKVHIITQSDGELR